MAPGRADRFSNLRLLDTYSNSWQEPLFLGATPDAGELPWHNFAARKSYVQHVDDRPGTPPADGFKQGSICDKNPGLFHR